MGQIIKINYGGELVEGEEMDFEPLREPWYEFRVHDGTYLKMKLIVSKIVRLKDRWTPQGEPIYVVQSSNVLSTTVPEHLLKKE